MKLNSEALLFDDTNEAVDRRCDCRAADLHTDIHVCLTWLK